MNVDAFSRSVSWRYKALIHKKVTNESLINQLRALRADLDQQTIETEVAKLAAESTDTQNDVLGQAVWRAKRGDPMEWETNEVDMVKNTLLKATNAVEMFREQIKHANSVFQEAAESLKSIKKIKNK